MEENKKFLWAVIILLCAVAIALAYGVYNRYAPSLGLGVNAPTTETSENQLAQTSQDSKTTTPATGAKKLSSLEGEVLAGVPAGSSESERQTYTDTVNGLAKDADQIKIAGCYADPLVTRVSKQKGDVAFMNNDSVSHLLAFNNGTEKFNIASKESKKIKISYPNGFGFYNYTCDNQTAGILIVGE